MTNWLEKLKSSLLLEAQNSTPQTSAQQVHVQSDKIDEIILSDGRFATIYKVKVAHVVVCQDLSDLISMAKLVTMCVKIDSESIKVQDVLNMEIRDFNEICNQLSKQFK